MKKTIIILTLLIIFISGCSPSSKTYDNKSATETTTSVSAPSQISNSLPQAKGEYVLSFTAKQESKQVTVKGETNLPEGSVIGLSMDKDLNNGHVNIIAQGDATVSNGRFSLNFGPFVKYVEAGDYEISATFTPMAQSSQSVLDEIGGKKAPKLKGPNVKVEDIVGFNYLTIESYVNWVNNEPKPQTSQNYIATKEEVAAGATDADIIRWCKDSCTLYVANKGLSVEDYNQCYGGCLEG